MKTKLNETGLQFVLESINKRLANYAASVFNTDPDWEAESLDELQSWINSNPGGVYANDPFNNRNVENYDVYYVREGDTQYYYDSGQWIHFTPNMKDYYTKSESDARFITQTDLDSELDNLSSMIANRVTQADLTAGLANRVTKTELDARIAEVETRALTKEEINIILEETGFPTV